MRTNSLRLALLLAALVGCAGERPPIPPQAKFEAPRTWRGSGTVSAGPLAYDWWREFNDPLLNSLVAEALAKNSDVQISASRIEEVAGQYALTKAQRLPNVVGEAVKERERDVNPGFGIPEVQTAAEEVLAVSFDADLFGRLRNSSAAARANLLATEAAHEEVRLAVTALVVRSYFALRGLRRRLEILQLTLEARRHTLKLVTRRVDAGYSAQLDLAQAKVELHATEQQVPGVELAIRKTEDALNVLLGRVPGDVATSPAGAESSFPAVPLMLPSALLRQRPDIAEAENKLVAADRSLDAARAAFMPDFQLSATYGSVTSTLIEHDPIRIFSIGGSVLAPIFDAGRIKAQADAAAARRDEAAFAYQKAALTGFAEVEDALAGVRFTEEQAVALREQAASLEKELGIARARYAAGYAPFLDQLDAERGLLSVRLALAQSEVDQSSAVVSLFQSLGGGWKDSDLSAARPVALRH